MSDTVISRDGTRIAFDRYGSGPAVVFIGGAMQFRGWDPTTTALAQLVADGGYTAIVHDRRGRGESADSASFGLEAEIDDLRALIEAAGGSAALYGNSSGGAIALAAAAAGLPITELVLWETPLGAEGGTDAAANLDGLRERLAAGDDEGAQEYFMKDMPPAWLEGAKNSPGWPVMVSMVHSLSADSEALAWAQSAPRKQLWASIEQPTVEIVGSETLPLMTDAAASIVANMPHASSRVIDGANHSFEAAVMAAALLEFLGA